MSMYQIHNLTVYNLMYGPIFYRSMAGAEDIVQLWCHPNCLTQLSQLWPELYNKDPEFGVSNSNSGGMFLDFHGLNSDERAAVKNEI